MSNPPRWDDPVWADSPEKFDFATGHWTSDGKFISLKRREEPEWEMPPQYEWREVLPQPTPTIEELLRHAPLNRACLVLYLLIALLARTAGDPVAGAMVALFFSVCALQAVAGPADKSKQRQDAARAQVENGEELGAIPVLLSIIQSRVTTGEDEGVVWIEDDGLYFSGTSCSFVLSRRDVHPLPAWRLEDRAGVSGAGLLFLQHPNRSLVLRFRDANPPAGDQDYSPGMQKFLDQLKEYRHKDAGPDERSYPPLEVKPELLSQRVTVGNVGRLRILAGLYVCSMFTVAGAPVWCGIVGAVLAAWVAPRACSRTPSAALLRADRLLRLTSSPTDAQHCATER